MAELTDRDLREAVRERWAAAARRRRAQALRLRDRPRRPLATDRRPGQPVMTIVMARPPAVARPADATTVAR